MEGDQNEYFQSQKEPKENISSIHTQCGGGNHGYTGNILSNSQYALIAPFTPFVVPPEVVPKPFTPEGKMSIVSSNTLRHNTEILKA